MLKLFPNNMPLLVTASDNFNDFDYREIWEFEEKLLRNYGDENKFVVPRLDYFICTHKPTDFLNLGYDKLAISEKALIFLNKYKLIPYSTHPIRFYYRKTWFENYRFIYFQYNAYKYFDNEKSEYLIKHNNVETWMKFDHYSQMRKLTENENYNHIGSKIYLVEEFDFLSTMLTRFCSQSFKDAMIKEKIIGYIAGDDYNDYIETW